MYSFVLSTATSVCTYLITTQSRCRTITPDGEAFKKCSYSNDDDRIFDLGSNIQYNTQLDGFHVLFINSYRCPIGSTTTGCVLANKASNGDPEPVTGNYFII